MKPTKENVGAELCAMGQTKRPSLKHSSTIINQPGKCFRRYKKALWSREEGGHIYYCQMATRKHLFKIAATNKEWISRAQGTLQIGNEEEVTGKSKMGKGHKEAENRSGHPVNRPMKRYLNSLIIRELQIKTSMSYPFLPTRLAKKKRESWIMARVSRKGELFPWGWRPPERRL